MQVSLAINTLPGKYDTEFLFSLFISMLIYYAYFTDNVNNEPG